MTDHGKVINAVSWFSESIPANFRNWRKHAVATPPFRDSRGLRKPHPSQPEKTETKEQMQQVIELFGQIMDDAGYKKVERSDIEKCVGVASQWGVPLHVDLGSVRATCGVRTR